MTRRALQQWRTGGMLVALAIDGVTASTPGLSAGVTAALIVHAGACLAFIIWTWSTDK